MIKTINIFVASPSDVKEERQIVKEVCEAYNQAIGNEITIKAHLYEDYPLAFGLNAQRGLTRYIRPSDCDITIVIMWERIGTILDDGLNGKLTKRKFITGTEWEIEEALFSGKLVFFYLKTQKKSLEYNDIEKDMDDITKQIDEAHKQKQLREVSFKAMNFDRGSAKNGYNEFESSDDFRRQIITHLQAEIERITSKKLLLDEKKEISVEPTKKRFLLYFFLGFMMLLLLTVVGVNYYSFNKKEIYQDIQYSRISVNGVHVVGSTVEVTLKLKSLDKKRGVAITLEAKPLKNYQVIFKVADSPVPILSELIDEHGSRYRFKSSTLKFGKTTKDWTIVQPNGEELILFTFEKEGEANMGKKFDFKTNFYFAIGNYKNESETKKVYVYLRGLLAV